MSPDRSLGGQELKGDMWNLTTSQCELFKVGVRQELDQYDGDLLKYMTCRERGIFKPKPMPK